MSADIELPRFIRAMQAPRYLGMNRALFDEMVRPYLTEIPIGSQGIAFDRLELDAWADDYKSRRGRPGGKKVLDAQWHRKAPDLPSVGSNGATVKRSKGVEEFQRAVKKATTR